MKTLAVLVALMLLWTGSVATANDGFLNAQVHGRVQALNARVQAVQLQQQAKLARQVQFLQQQQLVAANAVNVHSQLAQLRALQQAQAFDALHLNQLGLYQQSALVAPVVAAPVVQQHVVAQPVVQKVIQQPVVVKQQVVRQNFCAPQRVLRFRSCR